MSELKWHRLVEEYSESGLARAGLAALADGLAATGAGTNLWVAEGTYKPGATRDASFVLKPGMGVFGGFTSGMSAFRLRDWSAHPTVLLPTPVSVPVIRKFVLVIQTRTASVTWQTRTASVTWQTRAVSVTSRIESKM